MTCRFPAQSRGRSRDGGRSGGRAAARDELREDLESYHLWHATRADLLRRVGRREDSLASYRRAIELAQNVSRVGE